MSMWDVTDITDDVKEHVKVISTTMKKTVSGQFREKPGDESTPLLQVAANNTQASTDYETANVVCHIFNTHRCLKMCIVLL